VGAGRLARCRDLDGRSGATPLRCAVSLATEPGSWRLRARPRRAGRMVAPGRDRCLATVSGLFGIVARRHTPAVRDYTCGVWTPGGRSSTPTPELLARIGSPDRAERNVARTTAANSEAASRPVCALSRARREPRPSWRRRDRGVIAVAIPALALRCERRRAGGAVPAVRDRGSGRTSSPARTSARWRPRMPATLWS